MLCDSCGKNEASLHFTKIINGKKEEKHLCDECAAENHDFDFDNPFSMNKLFAGLIENIQDSQVFDNDIRCECCGLTYEDFRKEGKFGCSKCYVVFKNKLDPLIKGLHGHNTHRGKIPSSAHGRIFLKREEDDLRIQLENAVKEEEFEKAAIIRDRLKDLKIKLDGYGE